MSNDVKDALGILSLIVIVGLIYVIVSNGSNTATVISSSFNGLSGFLSTAMGHGNNGMAYGG